MHCSVYPLSPSVVLMAVAALLPSCGCSSLVRREPVEGSPQRLAEQLRQLLPSSSGVAGLEKAPSHARLWRADLAVLPYADIQDDHVRLYNIRDCEYRTEEDYAVRHFDRYIPLDDVRTIDFIVVPFKNTPSLAHTMLSFGLVDGEQIVFSVEARLEQGEQYNALASTTGQFELMWVVGTERDLIRLRTEVRDVEVFLYPTRVTPQQAQTVFLAALARVNEIARRPEHYDLLTNNCTTNIVDMVNGLRPGSIPEDIRVLLPGHSDRLAYDLGLLAAEGPFEQIKRSSKINLVAHLHADSPDFSRAIRTTVR